MGVQCGRAWCGLEVTGVQGWRGREGPGAGGGRRGARTPSAVVVAVQLVALEFCVAG